MLSPIIEQKLEEMLKSGQSEAIAIAQVIRDQLSCLEPEDNPNDAVLGMANEFVLWGVAVKNNAEVAVAKGQSLRTVNVIDCTNTEDFAVQQVRSFPENDEGNANAEALFKEWVAEAGGDEDDLPAALDDGKFEIGEGFIAITHST